MKWDEVIEVVKEVLDKRYWDKSGNGYYEETIFADYRNEFEDWKIKELMEADDPKHALLELFDEMECEHTWEYAYPELLKEIEDALWKRVESRDEIFNFEEYREDISLWLEDHVSYVADIAHYNRYLHLDLLVDSGDANYDYTCNNILNYASDEAQIPEESSMLWLAKSLGKEEEFRSAIKEYYENDVVPEDKFLSSAIDELINLSTSIGALTFLIKMPLLDYMDFISDIKEGKDGTILIPKNTTCGLYNRFNGGGSIFEIELPQDIEVPYSMVGDLVPDIDNCYGAKGYTLYSVAGLYGVTREWWDTDAKAVSYEKEEEAER